MRLCRVSTIAVRVVGGDRLLGRLAMSEWRRVGVHSRPGVVVYVSADVPASGRAAVVAAALEELAAAAVANDRRPSKTRTAPLARVVRSL